MSERIKINVGGTIFETIEETVLLSGYFRSLLSRWHDDPTKTPFIDRSSIAFDHVLSLLRNPSYPYPEEYLDELEFYCIDIKPIVKKSNNSILARLTELEELLEKQSKELFILRGNKMCCDVDGCCEDRFEYFPYCQSHGRLVPSALTKEIAKGRIFSNGTEICKILNIYDGVKVEVATHLGDKWITRDRLSHIGQLVPLEQIRK